MASIQNRESNPGIHINNFNSPQNPTLETCIAVLLKNFLPAHKLRVLAAIPGIHDLFLSLRVCLKKDCLIRHRYRRLSLRSRYTYARFFLF